MTTAKGWGCRSGAVSTRLGGAAVLVAVTLATPARADDADRAAWGRRSTARVSPAVTEPARSSGDGVYGRFNGDMDLGLALGGEADRGGARGAARLDLHYFSMAGVYVGGSNALGSEPGATRRMLSLGVDLRPGFVPRWAKGMQRGPAFVDLFVDSIALGVGAFWSQPAHGSFGDRRGFEASLGFGLPLTGRAPGPWIETRGLLRWADPGGAQAEHAVPAVLVLLSWHALFVSPLAHDPTLVGGASGPRARRRFPAAW